MPKRMQRVSETQPHDYASRLKVGQTFNSYAELCRHLNETVYTNTDRKARQLNKWSRSFTFTQNGKQITITKILSKHTVPTVIVNYMQSKPNNKKLYHLILRGLIQLMVRDGSDCLSITSNKLCEALGMLPKDYKHTSYLKLKQYLENDSISPKDLYQCYKLIDAYARMILKRQLQYLVNKKLITLATPYMGINKNGVVIELPEKIVQPLNEQALLNLGYVNMIDMQSQFGYHKFFQERNQLALEQLGYKIIYTQYQIKIEPQLRKYIIQTYPHMLYDIQEQIHAMATPRILQYTLTAIKRCNDVRNINSNSFRYNDNVQALVEYFL